MAILILALAAALLAVVWFCLGRHDFEVPAPLAARYFERLDAPRKALVWFENSAHMPNTEEKKKFNALMVETVLPTLTAQATAGV
ncbi:MAG TPA: alpha/beta hydrolase, partial [Longimicrobiales bacterium]